MIRKISHRFCYVMKAYCFSPCFLPPPPSLLYNTVWVIFCKVYKFSLPEPQEFFFIELPDIFWPSFPKFCHLCSVINGLRRTERQRGRENGRSYGMKSKYKKISYYMLSENIYGFVLVIWYSLVQYNIVRGILLIYFIDATDVKSKCPEMFISST